MCTSGVIKTFKALTFSGIIMIALHGCHKGSSRSPGQYAAKIHARVGRYPDCARIALTPEEAYRNKKKEILSIFIGIENGYAIGSDLGLIEEYHWRGVRYMTLCHSWNNDKCDSSTDTAGAEHGGLSNFGEEAVASMNRMGMMIDISHVSDESFYDVLKVSKVPVIASHSSARAVCDNPRNLSDSMILALAKHKGVIQLCLLSDYVKKMPANPRRDSARASWWSKYPQFDSLPPDLQRLARSEWRTIDRNYPPSRAAVSDLCDHVDHIARLAGVDCIGIGTDFDGGGLADCRDAAELGNITQELVRRGYSKKDISKIWGGNLMKVFSETIRYA